MATNMVA